MVLEAAYEEFGGVASVYILGYKLASDLPVFLNDMLMFSAELVINSLEVDIVA